MGNLLAIFLIFSFSAIAQGSDVQLVCTPDNSVNTHSLKKVSFNIKDQGKASDIHIEVIKNDSTAFGFTKQKASRSPASLFKGFASQKFLTSEGKEVYFIFKPNQLASGQNSTKKADAGLVWSSKRTYVPFHCKKKSNEG